MQFSASTFTNMLSVHNERKTKTLGSAEGAWSTSFASAVIMPSSGRIGQSLLLGPNQGLELNCLHAMRM